MIINIIAGMFIGYILNDLMMCIPIKPDRTEYNLNQIIYQLKHIRSNTKKEEQQ